MSGWKPVALLFVFILGWLAIADGLLDLTYGWLGPGTISSLILEASQYHDDQLPTVWDQLRHRLEVQPFNLIATLIFALAVVHTLLANKIHQYAKHLGKPDIKQKNWFLLELVYFLGEVEIIFGLWVIPLLFLLAMQYGWQTAVHHFDGLDYNEASFVIVIMALASSYPIVCFAEKCLKAVARIGGGGHVAWWVTLLTVAPLLGSFITEPAAMTLAALLLAKKFYVYRPTKRLAYATIGLLFTNISVGGVLTNFAAPPVLMVAKKWGWTTPYMMGQFGGKAIIGIALATAIYGLLLRKDFRKLSDTNDDVTVDEQEQPVQETNVPGWVTVMHLLFVVVAVANNHYPAIFIGTFLLFLGFHEATKPFQSPLNLRAPLLVGFFLAGLVVHVSLQAWWIEPLLPRLNELYLMKLSAGLTAFIDNAAITSLAALIPLTDALKYAVVSGAVIGGGLTVIANAPNPAGQAILHKFFPEGVSPLYLFAAALLPTGILLITFYVLREWTLF